MNRIFRHARILFILWFAMFCASSFFIGCSSNSSSSEEGYYVEDVEGNTLITNIGVKIKLLGVKEDSKQAEQFLRKHAVGRYVDLLPDSYTGGEIKTSEDEVWRYVFLSDQEENKPRKCLNSMIIDQYRKDVWDPSYVTDSLKVYSALIDRKEPSNKISDLALYMKQRTFLIRTPEGIGTGFFINDSGTAITNNHVLNNADAEVFLYAEDPDDSQIYANQQRNINNIVYTNPELDITIFNVNLNSNERVPYFSLADRHAKQGEFCATLGNPHNLTATYSAPGSVSAYRTDPYSDREVVMMQYTIPTNGGNSGGPVCLENGLVYAVHEMGDRSMQNTNYGIDILQVRNVLDQLGIKYGGK